jgi:hypothetical protein
MLTQFPYLIFESSVKRGPIHVSPSIVEFHKEDNLYFETREQFHSIYRLYYISVKLSSVCYADVLNKVWLKSIVFILQLFSLEHGQISDL